MKNSELKNLIKSILREQQKPNMGMSSAGRAGRQIVQTIPLEGISDEEAQELEQIINRNGGIIGDSKKIKIFCPPELSITIDFI